MADGVKMYATKEEVEEEKNWQDKEEVSPWNQPDEEDNEFRVCGWRDGVAMTKDAIKDLVKESPAAAAEYINLKKHMSHKRPAAEVDPLQGLPPAWQVAFSAAPPGGNPQAAFKEYCQKRRKQEPKKKEVEKPTDMKLDWESREGESPEEEIVRIKEEIERLSKVLRDNEKVRAWKEKTAESHKSLKEGEKALKEVERAFEIASYNKAVASGQLRSSDMYFQFLTQDTARDAESQVVTLERSCALMDKTMDLLKGHIKKLEEVAAMEVTITEEKSQEHLSPSPFSGKTPGPPQPSPAPGRSPLLRSPGPMASPGPTAAKLRALKIPPVSPSLRD